MNCIVDIEDLILALPQVSQISSVFDCLLEEEERTLKENPVDSVQWAEVVLAINNIIKVQCRCPSVSL